MSQEQERIVEAQVWVGGLVLRGSTILLGKRAATRRLYPNVWDVFGGHVEPHEEPDAALVRELREEVGITATQFAKLTVVDVPASPQHGPATYHLYGVTGWVGTPQNRLPEEHATIQWFSLEGTHQLELVSPAYRLLFSQLAAYGTQ